MIIDIHNHADFHGGTVKKLIANMDENGIDVTCLLSVEQPPYDYVPGSKHAMSVFSDMSIPFERCVHFYEQAPDRFLLGFCPDPRRPDAIPRLRSAYKTFDIALCGEMKLRMMYDDPDAIRMYRFCGENGLPVLMHFDYEFEVPNGHPWPNWWYGGDIHTLGRMLALCPETKFLGHAPGFWAHISNDDLYDKIAYPKGPVVPGGMIGVLMEKYPNLYCDIGGNSGHNALSRDFDYSRKFIIDYQDRVLFGRDFYDGIHRKLLEELGLPAEVLAKVYEGNARSILRNGDKIRR
jgi:predicted TIM-barrel fold metal-dependent hydrolase